jgi:hypothetical protein
LQARERDRIDSFQPASYFGDVAEAAGGHAVPEGAAPELFAWLFPVVGDEPGFGVAGSVDPRLDPFVVPELEPAVPGNDPQGDPLGDLPGAVEVLGFTVDGWVLEPGVGFVVEFEPGTVPGVELGFWGFEVLLAEPEPAPGGCGVVCGVDAPGAGEPCAPEFGLALCPVELCPAGALPVAEPLEPVLCATTHVAQHRRTSSVRNFCVQFIMVSSPSAASSLHPRISDLLVLNPGAAGRAIGMML